MRDLDLPRIDEAELAKKFESMDLSNPAQVQEVLKTLFPPVDSSKVQEIRATLASGERANPKELMKVLTFGSMEERLALREACVDPTAIARNQDLNLSKLIDALTRGDREAKSGYETSRVIIPEVLPQWALAVWDRSKSAPWRVLDLHGEEFGAFARKVRSEVEDQFREISIGVYNPSSPAAHSLIKTDERGSFLTYSTGRHYLIHMGEFATRRKHPRVELYTFANLEIRQDLRALGSPTVIGAHYRRVVDHELRLLFAAQIVEDACVAFKIPLDDASKVKLLRQIESNPWILCGQLKLERLREPLALLRAQGEDESSIGMRAAEFIFRPGALSEFNQARKPKAVPATAPPVPAAAAPLVWPPLQVVESRRTAIAKALEASPFKASFDVKRQTRQLMKLAGDSEVLFQRTLALLGMRGTPDAIVAELQSRRAHSAFKPDEPPTAARVETTQVELTQVEGTEGGKEAPLYSKRLVFKALVESYYGATGIDQDRTVRVLVKLTNESTDLFTRAVHALESGQNLEMIIADLRQRRAATVRDAAAPSKAPVMSPTLMVALGIGVVDAPRDELHFSFARHAEKALRDGSVRHVVHQALERYSERPELADVKKISDGGIFWELRLLRENLRVYFIRLSDREIRILRIGSKGNQDHDIQELPHTYQHDSLERAELLNQVL